MARVTNPKINDIIEVPHANTRSGNRVRPVYGVGIVRRVYQAKGGLAVEVDYDYASHRYHGRFLVKRCLRSDDNRGLTPAYFDGTAPDKHGHYLQV